MRLDCRNPAHIFVLDTAMNVFPKTRNISHAGEAVDKVIMERG